ncbi:MAG: hypothetical protein KGJ80_07700 [Chloroflexota bacterium]|nr:hypothetical protein [Chloroflexota bacterium]
MTQTRILIPEPISKAAEQLARQMGITLDEFYTAVVTEYVIAHEKQSVTESLNRIYATEPSSIDPVIARMQNKTLRSDPW